PRRVASSPMDGHALIDEALREARAAMDRAYAPYSGFPVGAAVIANGQIFTGQNIENASYPVSVCAERNAVGRMNHAGERGIHAIWSTEGAQVVLTDNPGYHKPRTLLGARLNELVGDAVSGVDVVLHVVDAAAGVGTGDAFVYEHRVRPTGARAICVVNKVD